ncbi:DUF4258 domain-containing protein [Candidatus Magnetominusculus dajiuhuensis]|uniref:DUF4258 domain-containing protein n=1 Tax=Candidatus Magnetominusculus dajiuhuensis TaxID=3137712 RepID=UPI003B43A6C3
MEKREIKFVVEAVSGRAIRTTYRHWDLITKTKHPEIENKEVEVRECLLNPIEIRRSSEDDNVCLYYLPLDKYFICVVVRHLNGDGFIITAYITDKVKEGEKIWKR